MRRLHSADVMYPRVTREYCPRCGHEQDVDTVVSVGDLVGKGPHSIKVSKHKSTSMLACLINPATPRAQRLEFFQTI